MNLNISNTKHHLLATVYADAISNGLVLSDYNISLSQIIGKILMILKLSPTCNKNKNVIEDFIFRSIDLGFINFVLKPGSLNSPMSFIFWGNTKWVNKVSTLTFHWKLIRFHKDFPNCFIEQSTRVMPKDMRDEKDRIISELKKIKYTAFPDWFHKFPIDGSYVWKSSEPNPPVQPIESTALSLVLDSQPEFELKSFDVKKAEEKIWQKAEKISTTSLFTKLLNKNWWIKMEGKNALKAIKDEIKKHIEQTKEVTELAEEILKEVEAISKNSPEALSSIVFIEEEPFRYRNSRGILDRNRRKNYYNRKKFQISKKY